VWLSEAQPSDPFNHAGRIGDRAGNTVAQLGFLFVALLLGFYPTH
jgi:hypothetical protein